ncbi:hypothetical protein H0H87_008541, partial [Tephrocybe sp. NHM501043]
MSVSLCPWASQSKRSAASESCLNVMLTLLNVWFVLYHAVFLSDAIHLGHWGAHKQLILHRDVSNGNLLIFEDQNGQTYGRLIDYDHAKKGTKSRPVIQNRTTVTKQELVLVHAIVQDGQKKVNNDDDDDTYEEVWMDEETTVDEEEIMDEEATTDKEATAQFQVDDDAASAALRWTFSRSMAAGAYI